MDFHSTFRALAFFRPSLLATDDLLEQYLATLVSTNGLTSSPREEDVKEWLAWLEKYAARILDEKAEWGAVETAESLDAGLDEREKEAKGSNPRFVLRQWVLEEVIKALESDMPRGKEILLKTLYVGS